MTSDMETQPSETGVVSISRKSDQSSDPNIPHGTSVGYVRKNCNCQKCRAWNTKSQAELKKKRIMGIPNKIPSYRLLRRIQALHAMGYTAKDIAEAGDAHISLVNNIKMQANRGYKEHYVRLFLQIDKAFKTLGRKPITKPNKENLRWQNKAARLGWGTPAAWENIDDPKEVPRGRRKFDNICVVEGCDRSRRRNKMCNKHDARVRRHGDPYHGDPVEEEAGSDGPATEVR